MRQRAILVAVLGALSAFGPLSVDFYLPGLPRLTHDFHAGASAGQLTLTACVLGLAFGQLGWGSLSDRFGRKPPLLVALAAYCVASVACAFAHSIWVLVLLRLVQGLAGAAGIVISRAVVRDLETGVEAARLYSILILVLGVVPVLAPAAGGLLLHVTSWRGLFLVLAAVDALILAATAAFLRESLAPEHRHASGGWGRLREPLRDRLFVGYSLVLGLQFGELFSYIAGSPFVLQNRYGVSPQLYGVVFGVNALGLVACSQLNRALVVRFSPARVLRAAVTIGAVNGVALLAVVLVGGVGLPGILPCLFVNVSMIGLVAPNAAAIALAGHGSAAGSASALLGAFQFAMGAAVAPIVGVAGKQSAVPMALLITLFALSARIVARASEGR